MDLFSKKWRLRLLNLFLIVLFYPFVFVCFLEKCFIFILNINILGGYCTAFLSLMCLINKVDISLFKLSLHL